MKSGWDATRRNRNIGAAKQGLGQDNQLVIPWCRLSLTPDGQQELERLRGDGHEIVTTRRDHKINVSLESIRATQLYRTLLHEIGHSVDNDRDPIAFDQRNSLEKVSFGRQYADKLRTSLVRFGIIPFARIFDKKTIARDGLSVSDFTVD